MSWYNDILNGAPKNTRFSSVRVGAFRVSLACDAKGQFGIAVCSPNDMFNRKQGQAIAFERLNSGTTKFSGKAVFAGTGGGENALFAAEIVARQCPDRFPSQFLCALSQEVAKLKQRTSK